VVSLRRTVRFSLPPTGRPLAAGGSDVWSRPKHNAFAGWPASSGISVYGELHVEVEGEPDPHSGYLVNITEIDRAVRELALPWMHERYAEQFAIGGAIEPATLLPEVTRRMSAALPVRVRSLGWQVTPLHSVTFETSMPNLVELRQSFEFSASHRLHCTEYDDDTNRRIFGKCNNPNGHGHNYRVEVAVAVPLGEVGRAPNPSALGLPQLEAIVDATVIRRFDHKHLNSDCPEFALVNPSVEHIAKVCHDLLVKPLDAAGGALRRVTVWETEKTSCTYPS